MTYDLIVIGAGPGGYVCAIRAAQLGMKVAIVEKRKTLGGTCLNVGCIPSKALLHASETFAQVAGGMAALGIVVDKPRLDLAAMMKHKDDTVAANVSGIGFLMKKNKIDWLQGEGRIAAPGSVLVRGDAGEAAHEAKHIVIATGSDVAQIPGVEINGATIVSSTGALTFPKVPGKLVVVGAGVIGLELGSVWRRLGAEVTVVEFLGRILPGMDGEVATQFQRVLEKQQGFSFRLAHKVVKAVEAGESVEIHIEPTAGGPAQILQADAVLVATGRRPYTENLGLGALGVKMDRGMVVVDDRFATNVSGLYAIGDVIRGPMLAHKAEHEGVALAEIISGRTPHLNPDVIPGVVYTAPEVAAVGKTEEELKAAGMAYAVGKFPFMANGRARAMRHTEGFVKVLGDAASGKLLGVHIVGFGAGELIQEACLLMELGGSVEDLARSCHAHPTMSEAVKEAAMAVDKRAIHI